MRIVLDANIFVSAAISLHGSCGKIIRTILENHDEFELILSNNIIIEIIASLSKPSVLRYSKKSIDESKTWMENIASLAIMVPDMEISFEECRDPDDVIYLAAANVAKANFIVSNDKDLLVLKRYYEIDIISPLDFIFLIKQILTK